MTPFGIPCGLLDRPRGSYGRGIIGALNYLASEGLIAFSFISFSVEGDDGNVTTYMGYGVTEWDSDVDTDSDSFTLLQEYFHLQSLIADDNYTF